jgi:transcriptional regulator with XRE-family HTH domain
MPVIREPGFAKRVKALRRERELTQRECAEAIGVTRQHWQNWESGQSKPRADRMVALATYLRCDEHWLRYGDNDREEVIERIKRMMRIMIRDLDRVQRSIRK